MINGRELVQIRRLEHGVAGLRWVVVAFGIAQTLFALRDQAVNPDYVLPPEFALVAILAVGTLVLQAVVGRAVRARQLRWVGVVGFVLDIVVITGLIWTSVASPEDPIWVIAYVLPLEGAVRYGLAGALWPVLVNLVSELLREAAGLGLYITKQLVEAMGGSIELSSKLGIGSTFRITLPATPGGPVPAPLSGASRAD